jgi:serine/threonine protein kinase/WD40 repeat protein
MFVAGTVIAHFTLEKEIGRGGQGAVYRAEDQRSGKKVALKVLRVGTEVPQKMFERFQREADITRKLDHPGICAVYENGTEGDIAWISMRLLTGQPLSRTWAPLADSTNETLLFESEDGGGVKVRALSTPSPAPTALPVDSPLAAKGSAAAVREAARVIEACARALHAAHEVGVIHRDVKPSNIMITASGDPIILDFGLARDADDDQASLTLSGTAVGTPSYMAPEQLRGAGTPIGRGVDVWALGVTLFESLAHRRPFEAATREGLYRAILAEEPSPVRAGHPEIPEDLEAIVLKCLEKNPADRYATALELAEDLHRLRMGEPVLARRANIVIRFSRWCARSPGLAALVLGSFFVLGISLGIAAVFAKKQSDSATALQGALNETRREKEQKELALRRADASLIAAKALALVDRDPATALALGIEASRRGAGTAADTAMLSALGVLNEVRTFDAPGLVALRRAGPVLVGLFERDGKRVADVLDPNSGRVIRPLGACDSVATCADSPTVALLTREANAVRAVRWIDVESGSNTDVPSILLSDTRTFAPSPDGRLVVRVGADRAWSVHRAGDWTEVGRGTLATRTDDIDAWFLDSETVAFRHNAGAFSFIEVRDAAGRLPATRIATPGITDARPLLVAPSLLAVAQNDRVVLHDLRGVAPQVPLAGHRDDVTALTLVGRSGFFASSSLDGTIRLWATRTGAAGSVLRGIPGPILTLCDAGDDRGLLSLGGGSVVTLWDRRSGHPVTAAEFTRSRGARGETHLAASGNHAFRSSTAGGGFTSLDRWTRGASEPVRGQNRVAFGNIAAVSADGRVGAIEESANRRRRRVAFVDLTQASTPTLATFSAPGDIDSIRLAYDGTAAAISVSTDGESYVEVLNLKTNTRTRIAALTDVHGWSADGRLLFGAFQSTEAVTQVHGAVGAADGKPVFTCTTTETFDAVLPLPDGRTFVAMTRNGALYRGTAEGCVPWIDRTHRSTANLRMQTTGAHVVTFSDDRDVAVWDAATGAEVMRIRIGQAVIEDAALTDDGGRLVVATSDGRITDWPMDVRAFAETRLPRRLSDSDLRMFGVVP